MMALKGIAIAIGTKAVSEWIKHGLASWADSKKKNSQDRRSWSVVTNKMVAQTLRMIERHSNISTVAFPKDTVKMSTIYVPLTLHSGPNAFVVSAYPRDLFAHSRKILIEDAAGMGKSTLTRKIYLSAIEEKESLPILVDLRRLTGEESIEQALADQFGISEKHKDIFTEFLQTQPLAFLFDGFDEVADDSKMEVSRHIRDFIDRNGEASYVMTSRPELHFSNFTDFANFRIRRLRLHEAHELIKRYGAAYSIPDRAHALLRALSSHLEEAVSSFLENPLLTSLLFRAFEFKSVVPVKRGVFYRQVFDALFESHDLSKEIGFVRKKKTSLQQDDFHRMLRATAAGFRKRRTSEVSSTDFLEIIEDARKSTCPDLRFQAEHFLADATLSVPVFSRDGTYVRWSHRSLMDYFLADYLLRDYTESKTDAIRRVAFGSDSFSSYNFLTLLQEADPTLFAEAVTIPAGKDLLNRFDQNLAALPTSIDRKTRMELAYFHMGYEIICTNFRTDASDWESMMKSLYKSSGVNPEEYSTRMMCHLSTTKCVILLFNRSMSAIQVALESGYLTDVRRRPAPRSEDNLSNLDFKDRKPFFSEAIKSGDWSRVLNQFKYAIHALAGPHLDLQTPNVDSLRSTISRLETTVSASATARSANVF